MRHLFALGAAAILMTGCGGETGQKASKYDMFKEVLVGPDEDTIQLWQAIETKGPDVAATFIKPPANSNCKMNRARGGSVTNITAYEGGSARVPLFFVKKRVIKRLDQEEPLTAFSLQRANMTDVIVTETEDPVNLLLSTHDANLWVIHSAPDVDINSINVVGYEGAGVIAPGVDPSKIKFIVGGRENRKCWPKPERAEKNPEGYKKWQSWIRKNIGRVANNYDSEYRLDAALVGPAPLEPIAASPIGGAIIVDASRYHDVFWGSKKDAAIAFPPPPKN